MTNSTIVQIFDKLYRITHYHTNIRSVHQNITPVQQNIANSRLSHSHLTLVEYCFKLLST